jgi:hypothetical protein
MTVLQFRMAHENHGKGTATIGHQLDKPLQSQQCLGMQIMRFVDEERDGLGYRVTPSALRIISVPSASHRAGSN